MVDRKNKSKSLIVDDLCKSIPNIANPEETIEVLGICTGKLRFGSPKLIDVLNRLPESVKLEDSEDGSFKASFIDISG